MENSQELKEWKIEQIRKEVNNGGLTIGAILQNIDAILKMQEIPAGEAEY